MSMEKKVQMAESVLKAALASKASVSGNTFEKNSDQTDKLEIAKQMVEQLCGGKKLMRYLLEKRYRQLKAGKSENNKNDMAAVKTLRRVLNGGIISIFICINEAAPGKNVLEGNVPGNYSYDCLIWNQEGILVRGGTSENCMEGAILDFLANALGLDDIRSGECSEKMLFSYLAVLGLTLEGFGDSVCFMRRLKND